MPAGNEIRKVGGRAKRRLRRLFDGSSRSRRFRDDPHGRFWWHHMEQNDYVPPLYKALSRREWALMSRWYDDSARVGGIGEINVPAMSLLQGLLMGNGVRRTVELGHYHGYSTLLTGFMLRAMGNGGQMVSIDLDPKATAFTQKWVDRAGLNGQVTLRTGDSSDPAGLEFAVDRLGGMPEVILLDSSHRYEHTLRELDLWVPRMFPGSIMLLHDTSDFARQFDGSGGGGVKQAIDEWLPGHPEVAFLNLNGEVKPGSSGNDQVYKDGCGLGILQRRA